MDAFDAKYQYYKALKEKIVRRAREDSNVFSEYVFGYKNSPFHPLWHQFIDTHQYGALFAYRDSGKSEQISVARTCYEIGRNPDIRIKIASETDDLVGKIMSRVGATLLKNERYKEVFPDIRPSDVGGWAKFSITVDRQIHHKDPTVEGGGILTATTGGRFDLCFFDDIVGMRNTLHYPRLREQVKEAFRNNWLNLADGPHARWYLIGTPWHATDLISEIRANPNIPKCQEIWVGDNFTSPWPERFPDEYFKSRLGILGQRAYNRAYRGVALTDEESWINSDCVKNVRDFTVKAFDILSNSELPKVTGIDLGHRDGPDACPTVIFSIARVPNTGKRIPCEIKIIRDTSSILDIGRAIIKTWEDVKPALILVENNGAQKWLTDLLTTMGPKGIPVQGYFTGTQKLDLNVGVPSLLAEIEKGEWLVPLGAGGDHDFESCQCVYCYWMREVRDYPLSTTDTLMASWFALEAIRKLWERGTSTGGFSLWSWT